MSKKVVVIGAGPAGYVCAIRLAQLGQSVTVVERDALGGVCLNVGCVPSKALIAAGSLIDKARKASTMGISFGEPKVEIGKLVEWKQGIVAKLTGGVGSLLKNHGIKVVRGNATFADAKTLKVSGGSDGAQSLTADVFVIATGSVPIDIPGFKCDEKDVWSSTGGLAPTRIPEHLVVIGGGYIGLELGSVWNRLGSKVTVLEALDRILPGMDQELSQLSQRAFTKQGIEFRLQSWVESAKVENGKCIVRCKGAEPIESDRVLLATGRVPLTQNIGLENVGIETDKRGFVPVDSNFQTKVPGIYALGDVIGGAMLAHKAMEEGVVCVERMQGIHSHFNYDCIPAIVYTHPEIATVGKTEEQLKESGIGYKKGVGAYGANGRARTLGEAEGRVKILADAKTDRVLGVHILGARAGDLIAEASIAMEFGASSEDIARSCHAHPTLAETIHEAALAVDGRAIHSA